MYIQKGRKRVLANEEVFVEPEATDLLFEAEDVAELVSEVTGEAVEVAAEEEFVTFTVGEDEYTVTAEGDEEILESRRVNRKNRVNASVARKNAPKRRPTMASNMPSRNVRPARRRRPVQSSRTVAQRKAAVARAKNR